MQALQQGDASAQAQLEAIYAAKEATMDSLRQADPLLAKVFLPLMWRPFDPNQPGPYEDALAHFAGEYLKGEDLQDPAYDYVPSLSDNMPAFIQIVFRPGVPALRSEAALDDFLQRLRPQSRAHKNALASAVSTLDQMQQLSFVKYAEAYRDLYGPLSEQVGNYLEGRLAYYADQAQAEARLALGAVAPEIALPTPEGNTLRLSSLRGKVVLVDFWASWCGPCRRENPNVVRVYQRYKDQGFEILGVSLDRSREPWLKAIADDGLSWKHVSDLRFWQSEAAKTYNIASIPATVLLDREGRILAKNLRGAALEAKLAEIFGG
ncbi:MAG: TlpA family protein disulfide reductase [Bacteroidetes bacterium]|nr:MAG: TlpA family protein disulfide reductase [Bacteroidota bacterium]